jgi:hypothetical protein
LRDALSKPKLRRCVIIGAAEQTDSTDGMDALRAAKFHADTPANAAQRGIGVRRSITDAPQRSINIFQGNALWICQYAEHFNHSDEWILDQHQGTWTMSNEQLQIRSGMEEELNRQAME